MKCGVSIRTKPLSQSRLVKFGRAWNRRRGEIPEIPKLCHLIVFLIRERLTVQPAWRSANADTDRQLKRSNPPPSWDIYWSITLDATLLHTALPSTSLFGAKIGGGRCMLCNPFPWPS